MTQQDRCTARCLVVEGQTKRCQRREGHPNMHYWLEAVRSDGTRTVAFWEGVYAQTPNFTGELTPR